MSDMPIINFSFDNQSLDAKFYFDEKLISKKFFNLKKKDQPWYYEQQLF